jgi:uncharacterized protein
VNRRERAARDAGCVETQLGRAPHPYHRVVARCPWGRPAVIEDLPYDRRGRPFPTLFWATCPSLVRVVAALESAGGVRRFERRLATDPRLAASLKAAARYERRRRRGLAVRYDLPMLDAGAALAAGIGGVADPARLKCLHAHAAHALARPGYLLGAEILAEAEVEGLWGDGRCCTDVSST